MGGLHENEATIETIPWDASLFPEDDTRELRHVPAITKDEHGTHEIRVPRTAKGLAWKHEDFADSGNPDNDSGPVWVDGIPLGVTTWSDYYGDGLTGTESVIWYTLGQAKKLAEILGAVLEIQ